MKQITRGRLFFCCTFVWSGVEKYVGGGSMVNSPKEILLMKRSIERNKGNHKKLRALKSLSKLHRCCTHVIDERGSASYSLFQSSKFSFFQNRK